MTLSGWEEEEAGYGMGPLISSGLVGRWRFLEGTGTTVADASGNSRTATLTASPAWGAGARPGEGSLDFNGTTQYATIADNDAFSIITTGEMSWAAWARMDATGINQGLITKGSSSGYEYAFRPESLAVYLSGGAANITVANPVGSLVGRWAHYAATYQIGVGVRFFVDGSQTNINTTFAGTPIANTTAPVNIGRRADNAQYLDGKVSDCRIYNRTLSPQEIYRIAKMGA